MMDVPKALLKPEKVRQADFNEANESIESSHRQVQYKKNKDGQKKSHDQQNPTTRPQTNQGKRERGSNKEQQANQQEHGRQKNQ